MTLVGFFFCFFFPDSDFPAQPKFSETVFELDTYGMYVLIYTSKGYVS